MKELVAKIAKELSLSEQATANAVRLLFNEDCSIPFVARYRKEQTDSMSDINLRKLRDSYTYGQELETLRERYTKVIEEHSKSKPQVAAKLPELLAKLKACTTKQELEDIYLPFKAKRVTKAAKAKEKGLEPLVDKLLESSHANISLGEIVEEFRASLPDVSKNLSQEEILDGARDILAERLSETAEIKQLVREISKETGTLIASLKLSKEELDALKDKTLYEKYENYFSYSEPLEKAAAHRVMALRRGEADKVLRVKIEVDKETIITEISRHLLTGKTHSSEVISWISSCAKDSYTKQIAPSIETELRLELKKFAESDAINVFSKNLERLLMLPIIPNKIVMGIDPGIRTGSKIAVISETGKLLAYTTIYPDLKKYTSDKTEESMKTLKALIEKYEVSYISIGNGTGGRDIEAHVKKLLQDLGLTKAVRSVLVNESGASVYSVEPIAIEEFPDLDPTIRSAVSIARRLQDPLAELVKIEPRSIGVGQYQHDCNALKLNDSLKDVVESCVNKVGVNINTASHKLLSYVSGIGASLGKKIVEFRDNNGPFLSREDFKKIPSFGDKTFVQSAGFLRVPESKNILDKTSVHPERYELLEKIAKENSLNLLELVQNKEKTAALNWEAYANEEIGIPTLQDIKKELLSPGRDPRKDGSKISYTKSLVSLDELKLDMKLKGTVSNVTNFGAFVDIGLHQDGLVHISELSDSFVKDPASVVAIGDVLNVRVIGLDLKRKRISLSCKNYETAPVKQEVKVPKETEDKRRTQTNPSFTKMPQKATQGKERLPSVPSQQQTGQRQNFRKPPKQDKSYSVGDLLSKFNTNNK